MLKIKNTLRRDSAIAEQSDVLQIKGALSRIGYYNIPAYGLTPYPDIAMFDAVKAFQKDNGLKQDGIITPKGETLSALNDHTKHRYEKDKPGVSSPTIWCPQCGGPHGGSKGNLCPDCDSKN